MHPPLEVLRRERVRAGDLPERFEGVDRERIRDRVVVLRVVVVRRSAGVRDERARRVLEGEDRTPVRHVLSRGRLLERGLRARRADERAVAESAKGIKATPTGTKTAKRTKATTEIVLRLRIPVGVARTKSLEHVTIAQINAATTKLTTRGCKPTKSTSWARSPTRRQDFAEQHECVRLRARRVGQRPWILTHSRCPGAWWACYLTWPEGGAWAAAFACGGRGAGAGAPPSLPRTFACSLHV